MPEKLALALDQFAGSGSRLDGIAHKALADALKRLERNGLMTRTALPTALIGVEHAITPLGHSLREPFKALCAWALANDAAIKAANLEHDRINLHGGQAVPR